MAEHAGLIPIGQAARLLMISEERIRQLVKQGFIPKPEKRGFVQLVGAVQGYLRYLKDDERRSAKSAADIPVAGRDALNWQEILQRRAPYRLKEVPDGVLRLGMGVDVQKLSLYYTIRGFGARGRSWLIDRGQLYGPTDDDEVWNALADLMLSPIAGLQIERVFIDSGFRPNKPDAGDEHKVYEFTRR